MIKKFLTSQIIVNLILLSPLMSQTLSGIYSLRGVREMASAFKFEPDGSFQFFYSYGAVDRFAEGNYKIEGDKVILMSTKEGGKDFEVINQKKKGNKYFIKVVDPNSYLTENILVIGIKADQKYEYVTDENGIVEMKENSLDRIVLQHGLYPDIYTSIMEAPNDNTYFEVALKPSLEQVSFKGIDLKLVDGELHCLPNYLMPFENIRFVKEP